MSLSHQISTFQSCEPFAAGTSPSSIPFMKLIPNDKKEVLVIGCGGGYEVKWFTDHGFNAQGITNNPDEAKFGRKNLNVKITVSDMHEIPVKTRFDVIFASNVLEHSVAPFIALTHWRTLLKKEGWLIVVLPSKEWLTEYYHYSVLTHSQTIDLLAKAGFEVLAGPQTKSKITIPKGADIFYDLGRGWGHYDGYVAQKTDLKSLPKIQKTDPGPVKSNFLRKIVKLPYNYLRVWYARNHRE